MNQQAHTTGTLAAVAVAATLKGVFKTLDKLKEWAYKQEAKKISEVADRVTAREPLAPARAQQRAEQRAIADTAEQLGSYGSSPAAGKDWNRSVDRLARGELSKEEIEQEVNSMAEMESRIGAAGVASAAVEDTLGRADIFRDTEPQQASAKAESREQFRIVQVIERLTAAPSERTANRTVEPAPETEKRKSEETASVNLPDREKTSSVTYSAEDYNITKTGNVGTITDKSGNLLFQYEWREGKLIIQVDRMSDRQRSAFLAAHAALKQDGLKAIVADPSGRTQVERLGGLAPQGARAVALGSLVVSDAAPVVSNNLYTFQKEGEGYVVIRRGDRTPQGGQVIAKSEGSGRIAGEPQSAEERAWFAKQYAEVKAQLEAQQQATARDRNPEQGGRDR